LSKHPPGSVSRVYATEYLKNRSDLFLTLAKASNVCSGSFSTESGSLRHVRFTPDSDGRADIAVGPVRANRRHPQAWLDMKEAAN
jgi:hypothetical protein